MRYHVWTDNGYSLKARRVYDTAAEWTLNPDFRAKDHDGFVDFRPVFSQRKSLRLPAQSWQDALAGRPVTVWWIDWSALVGNFALFPLLVAAYVWVYGLADPRWFIVLSPLYALVVFLFAVEGPARISSGMSMRSWLVLFCGIALHLPYYIPKLMEVENQMLRLFSVVLYSFPFLLETAGRLLGPLFPSVNPRFDADRPE